MLKMGSRELGFQSRQAVMGPPSSLFKVSSGHKGKLDFHVHLEVTVCPCNSPLSSQRTSSGKNQDRCTVPSTLGDHLWSSSDETLLENWNLYPSQQ